MSGVTSSPFLVIVNGEPSGIFGATRGCPLFLSIYYYGGGAGSVS